MNRSKKINNNRNHIESIRDQAAVVRVEKVIITTDTIIEDAIEDIIIAEISSKKGTNNQTDIIVD